jgi:hypothetical protein
MKGLRFRLVAAVTVAVCFLALAEEASACRFRRGRCVKRLNVCCQPVYCQPSCSAPTNWSPSTTHETQYTNNASNGSVAWQPKDESESELGAPPKSASDVTLVTDKFAL